MSEAIPVRDATTVLLLRDGIGGIGGTDGFEVFMVRRTSKAAFMASAMVFPGGRLDESDCDDDIAARCDLNREAAAARLGITDGRLALGLLVAGVRETFEEAGVLLAQQRGERVDLREPAEAARFAGYRDALNGGRMTLGAMVAAEALTLSVATLWPYARWITPPIETRRFDAWFVVTRAPVGQTPLHDAVETTASAWLAPRAALAAYAAGEIQLAPPTLRVLLELEGLGGAGAVIDGCQGRRLAPIAPQPVAVGSELHLVLPGDRAFDPPGAGWDRICLRGGKWVSERA